MAHYAQVDDDGLVLQVLVMDNDMEANEGEQACIDWLGEHITGGQYKWVKTSYNSKISKKFAGIGDRYDETKNLFIARQPFPSWTLDKNSDWQAPAPYPDDGEFYVWDEKTLSWGLV